MTSSGRDVQEAARRFWSERRCGSVHTASAPGTRRYFEEADAFRYTHEPVASFAQFDRWRGKRVLEIGTGMGGDLSRFLQAGADTVGVDLSPSACEATTQRLELWDLPRRFARANALHLPFASETFDLVWSWGVLHHVMGIESAVAECRNVLKPGGEIRLMLYHRPSWVAIALWVRWALLRGQPQKGLKGVVAERMESAGTLALTAREMRELLAGFADVDVRIVGTIWDRRAAPLVGRLAGPWLGWFALVTARKP